METDASMTIRYGDARRGRVELDVVASEVDDLASKGEKGSSGPQAEGSSVVQATARRACEVFVTTGFH